jgi:CheY-like chemotaxis protein
MNLSDYKILIVDDDPNTVEMHARMVLSHSTTHRVLKARNGREALEMLQHDRADLVWIQRVLTGAGRGFCAGADMAELQHASEKGISGLDEIKIVAEREGKESSGTRDDFRKKYSYFPGCSLKGTGRAYEESLLPVFKALDIELEELDDWNCCGATAYMAVDEVKACVMASRNLALAERGLLFEELLPVPQPLAGERRAREIRVDRGLEQGVHVNREPVLLQGLRQRAPWRRESRHRAAGFGRHSDGDAHGRWLRWMRWSNANLRISRNSAVAVTLSSRELTVLAAPLSRIAFWNSRFCQIILTSLCQMAVLLHIHS